MLKLRRGKDKLGISKVIDYPVSYSQSGEDIIIDFALNTIGVKTRFYLDIGANEPKKLNNTYYFYLKGFSGISVDPDPKLASILKKDRPRDEILNIGVGDKDGTMTLYLMDPDTLNTFSKEEVELYKIHYPWVSVRSESKVKITNINKILFNHKLRGDKIDILSLDTEGLDLSIIKSIDFNKYRPKVFCVETAEYLKNRTLSKNLNLIAYMQNHNYFTYADTFVNTIFVDKDTWKNNNGPDLRGFK